MTKKSRIMAGVVALAMTMGVGFSFVGCSSKPDYKIWVAEAAVDLTKKQIEDFNKNNTDGIKINAAVEAVGEGEAATQMVTDVEAGADLYCFAQDQFARLVQAGALSQLGTNAANMVKTNNDAGSVSAVTSGETIYAYPLTSDNGYFMYYDKSVITDESHLTSLEALIKDCEDADKMFSFELGNSAWYAASFFFATGCKSEWETNDDGDFIEVNDTFNSQSGLISAKGMYKLVSSKCYNDSSASNVFSAAIPSAILVSGTWAYNDILDQLGDNLGVAELPSFEVDGTKYHLGSYSGCKLMGVKPQTDPERSAALHKLAQYLTGEAAQTERFNELAWGPSNLNAQKDEAVQANPALAALLKQNSYATPQGQIHGSWWDIGKTIAAGIKDTDGSEAALQGVLDTYKASIEALFKMS
ncbi:MAG: extracellular solute-binding protein, partial [Candidatus Coproplasma sp.]